MLERTRTRRLPPEVFDLPVEKMREGYYTDVYFNYARETLLEDARRPRVVMQVFQRKHAVLGGMESSLKILMSNAHINCNLTHTRLVEAFAPDASVFGSEYLTEKLETSAGWSPPQPDEDWAQGHRHMLEDFVASVAESRPPQSDGELGRDAIRVVYSAYVAAEEGRRVSLDEGDPGARLV